MLFILMAQVWGWLWEMCDNSYNIWNMGLMVME